MSVNLCIKNKPIGHYVLSLLSLLFRDITHDPEKISITAYGRAIGRSVDFVNLICNKFAASSFQLGNINIKSINVSDLSNETSDDEIPNNTKISKIEISLKKKSNETNKKVKTHLNVFLAKVKNAANKQQEMNICELEFIFSTLLKEGYNLYFSCPEWMEIEGLGKKPVKGSDMDLGWVFIDDNNLIYKLNSNENQENYKNNKGIYQSMESALLRMGMVKSKVYKQLAEDMCRYDDVIIALDTNMFFKSQITTTLLDSIVGISHSDYLDTPNWITIVASAVSIGELEHKANRKPDDSGTSDTVAFRERREACRGLQEFMELSSCIDLEGVSIFITGDISPELNFSTKEGGIARDEAIRKSIKTFFKNIDFHKGVYFLTMDKICEMFAKAEGLYAYYLPRDEIIDFYNMTALSNDNDINNISELIYELGIQFPLEIKCSKGKVNETEMSIIIETDWAEKTLEDWANRRIRFSTGLNKKTFEKLTFSLKEELKQNKEKIEKLEKTQKNTDNINKKIKLIEEKISNLKNKYKYDILLDLLKENGLRINFHEILEGWKDVNEKRHIV